MNIRALLWTLAVASVLTLSGCKGESNNTPAVPPQPTNPAEQQLPVLPPKRRNNLYFGYFGAEDSQAEEVIDHVNMWFEPSWGGLEVGIRHMQKAQLPTIFVLDQWIYLGNPRVYVGTEKAKEVLRGVFTRMREANVLKYVVALYPIDEPDIKENDISSDVIIAVNNDLRAISTEFPELKDIKLCVTYGGNEDYRAVESYDWIGFDDYGAKEQIFTNGKYDRLKSRLHSSQRITLFPGGCAPWYQDPKPFYLKAIEDEQVIAIIPFIWIDNAAGSTNPGIRTACPDAYREVGKLVKGPWA